jgi:transcriptional regulator with XRE-family HTH domain
MFAPTPFGVMLKETRECAKLSQFDLASGLGKTAQYISNIEKGKNNSPPDDEAIFKLIALLGLKGSEAEKFRFLAYADRGMLPPEMFRYVFESPALAGLISYAVSNSIPIDYWDSVYRGILERKAD